MRVRCAVRNVSCRLGGASVLTDISFEVGPGELVALMGRNGAGKSTALDVMAGLRPADDGDVWLDGRPLAQWDPRTRAQRIAHLPQSVRGDLAMTASELVLMGRYPHADRWFEGDVDRDAVDRAMRRTDCLALASRTIQTLSGGERQRVLLAACLAQQAPLLLVDEPSTYLDIDQQLQCFSLLRQDSDAGGTCVVVTHDLNLALRFATRLIILEAGRLVLDRSIASASDDDGWLCRFSSRLRLTTAGDGRPWVWYA